MHLFVLYLDLNVAKCTILRGNFVPKFAYRARCDRRHGAFGGCRPACASSCDMRLGADGRGTAGEETHDQRLQSRFSGEQAGVCFQVLRLGQSLARHVIEPLKGFTFPIRTTRRPKDHPMTLNSMQSKRSWKNHRRRPCCGVLAGIAPASHSPQESPFSLRHVVTLLSPTSIKALLQFIAFNCIQHSIRPNSHAQISLLLHPLPRHSRPALSRSSRCPRNLLRPTQLQPAHQRPRPTRLPRSRSLQLRTLFIGRADRLPRRVSVGAAPEEFHVFRDGGECFGIPCLWRRCTSYCELNKGEKRRL